jgi:hypothetical protein
MLQDMEEARKGPCLAVFRVSWSAYFIRRPFIPLDWTAHSRVLVWVAWLLSLLVEKSLKPSSVLMNARIQWQCPAFPVVGRFASLMCRTQ